jgi:hypothetical protein
MKRIVPAEHTARVVAVAVVFFGAMALLGWADGVFAKLAGEELASLAGFALGFALLTWRVDPAVRGLVAAAARQLSAWFVTWREPGRALRSAYQRSRSPRGARASGRLSQR